jgi:hypothetical protein
MALPFLQPSLDMLHGLFPSFNLDLPMPDEASIESRTLMLKCDFDSMICDPPSQTVETDS